METEHNISVEDELRLNVLLAQSPAAIRIDQSKMRVYGLTAKGEARIELNPNCEDPTYIRRIKAMLSSHVMGSPGGYPVFLERWTRMGQTRDASLEQLLLLGESEAVVAVAHAPGLTVSLAERAWWAMPDVANARVMLANHEIADSPIGRELASFLIEFLPFETEAIDMVESVRLVLQPGLIDQAEVANLWSRAQSKRSMLVGFLHALPDDLPLSVPACSQVADHLQLLNEAGCQNNSVYQTLARVSSPQGQAFIHTCELALSRVSDQNVTVSLFEAIAGYFKECRHCDIDYKTLDELDEAVLLRQWPDSLPLQKYVRSLCFLAAVSADMLTPVFARTDAVGSGMRRKIKPLTDRIFHHLQVLRT